MQKNLFRLHGQENDKLAKEIVRFVKDYFGLFNKKVQIKVVEFKLESYMGVELAQPKGKMFDLIMTTSDENKFDVAHACAWSYCKGGNYGK
jgi:hypothetical protein